MSKANLGLGYNLRGSLRELPAHPWCRVTFWLAACSSALCLSTSHGLLRGLASVVSLLRPRHAIRGQFIVL